MYIPTADVINAINSLNSKDARQKWEREFNINYIQPILVDLEQTVNQVMDLIARDKKQGKCSVLKFISSSVLYIRAQ